jgi:predicted nucleic acid-binding protein
MSIVSNASPLINLAKHKGLIQNVRPCLEALRDLAGFRLSGDLSLRLLQDEGEI